MRIGELAQTSGTPIETIRFYEREGLLPAAARTEGNYRIYTPQHADRLGFIRQCRSLDMTLDEVRVLLRFKDQPLADCGAVLERADAVVEGGSAGIDGLCVEFVQQRNPGGEKQAFGPDIAQRLGQFADTLIKTRAEFLQPGFLAGSAAKRVALSTNQKVSLGHETVRLSTPS